MTAPTLTELSDRASRLVAAGGRRVLGITGAPGAGKSTLAAALGNELHVPVVSLDGFHLSNDELRRLNRLDRKGAPDTFDGAGFVAMLRRLHAGGDAVLAPAFDRAGEAVMADAITVPCDAGLVVVEGNYLLLETPPWNAVRDLLAEVWFLDHPRRVERLVARHVEFGRTPAAAHERATAGSDGDNARLIMSSRDRADLVLAHGWLCS
jgi:pantothenate kinase